MEIEILATESLGVRGLCCFVTTSRRRILIDPGVALGYNRFGLHPHPFQVAVGERIRERLIEEWNLATDIIISHFHGDHTPLAHPNPYQLHVNRVAHLNPEAKIWTKDPSNLSPLEEGRAKEILPALGGRVHVAKGEVSGELSFSLPVLHGDGTTHNVSVIMTKVVDGDTFVHAPGIQLINDKAVYMIVDWHPDVVLVDGPPLYLHQRFTRKQAMKAWKNAKLLSEHVKTLIIDHHLMRSLEGIKWLGELSRETGKRIICGADFMGKRRLLLEAIREELYRKMPVPQDWEEKYSRGEIKTDTYWEQGRSLYLI